MLDPQAPQGSLQSMQRLVRPDAQTLTTQLCPPHCHVAALRAPLLWLTTGFTNQAATEVAFSPAHDAISTDPGNDVCKYSDTFVTRLDTCNGPSIPCRYTDQSRHPPTTLLPSNTAS